MEKGLDYNTAREPLIMPEYGREVQLMVKKAMTIGNRAQRQKYAESIIDTMRSISQQTRTNADFEHKLWDHLALMSGFQLDIDYPFDVSKVAEVAKKPAPMAYPMKQIPVRHYGALLFEMFDKLKTMPDGEEYNKMVTYCANQMKRMLMTWSHSAAHDEKVADDLAHYTDGRVQLDLSTFKFEKMQVSAKQAGGHKKKKK